MVLACGVYLKSRIIIGECSWQGGPQGLTCADEALRRIAGRSGLCRAPVQDGHARAAWTCRTIDFCRHGAPVRRRAGRAVLVPDRQARWTTARCAISPTPRPEPTTSSGRISTARPCTAGTIHGTGARYCPSIEDKVVRFADKERHPRLPGAGGRWPAGEWYVQGMSTSMPEDVQRDMYRSIPGLEHARAACAWPTPSSMTASTR